MGKMKDIVTDLEQIDEWLMKATHWRAKFSTTSCLNQLKSLQLHLKKINDFIDLKIQEEKVRSDIHKFVQKDLTND